jgi:DNA internalization-related competence protein ComEC/Rec2
VNDGAGQARAVRPLWGLTLGAAVGAGATLAVPAAGPVWLHATIAAVGLIVCAAAIRGGHRTPVAVWLLAGLALVCGRGLHAQSHRLDVEPLMNDASVATFRARLVVVEGWTRGRWGFQTRARVLEAHRNDVEISLPRRCRLEIRGDRDPTGLPAPGAEIRGLVMLRGSFTSPLLVASSQRLITDTGRSRPLPRIRQALVHRLFRAAGHSVDRIRSAELAATLALGRRDLVPRDRRDGWRRSGLAHALAVSGLHVGLVAGMAWLVLGAAGARLTTTRITLLLVLPTYALLAGASPSATRAAVMGMVYLGSRLLGRAIVPMAAVLLTTLMLLVVDPTLIADAGFQLTVILTAALVRWAPGLAAALPGPRWLAGAIAVPIVAQLAAAPLVAIHFSSLVPAAVAANLLVPWLLGPVVLLSVGAVSAAPLWPSAAGRLLDLVSFGQDLLWLAGAPGRVLELVPPSMPVTLMVVLVVAGIAALLPGRKARVAAACYIALGVAAATWWLALPGPAATEVELLDVGHGLAARVSTGGTHLLADGGGRRLEAASKLAASRVNRLDAVIATHGDEDHIGGLETVLRTIDTRALVLPAWLVRNPEAVGLLRQARHRMVRIVPVARGSRVRFGKITVEVLWPPARHAQLSDNERSMVARLGVGGETVLLTADIGHATERALSATSDLGCSVLVVPHHGSRTSAGNALLDAASPSVALIPAGPDNRHNHPSTAVLDRLDARRIAYRAPIFHGRCGARLVEGEWVPYPDRVSRRP